jgi:pimeloyl-ACP methyl ester carboxylesterase
MAPAAPDLPGRLLSTLAAGIDELAMRAARAVIDRTVMPAPEAAGALRAQARFYARTDLLAEPRRFFDFMDRPEPVPAVRLEPRRSRMPGSERARAVFPSPYRPANPAFAAEHASLEANHWAHAEIWRHREREATATVVLLHGFGMGNPRLDARLLMAPALFAAGLDVVLFTLPLHGKRSPEGTLFSGQLFASADVTRLNEAMAQAVHDLSALLTWLWSRGAGPIGLLGVSLGGYVAALMAALRDDLAFVVPVVAPVCFGDLAWRFMSGSARYRSHAAEALGREEFRAAYRLHSPLAHAARVPRERLLIVAGRGDRVVPAEHPLWLREHWGRPRMLWFSGSHLAPFGRAEVVAEIGALLADLGLLGR